MICRYYFAKTKNGQRLYKTYSDMGYYIKQNPTGVIYSEAVDVESAPYTYEETDELIVLSAEEKEAFEKEQEEKNKIDEQ